MPYLHDEDSPMIDRRAPKAPVAREPGPHVYRLTFDCCGPEDVIAMSPAEAVAKRAGGSDARLPSTITDMTEVAAWITRMTA